MCVTASVRLTGCLIGYKYTHYCTHTSTETSTSSHTIDVRMQIAAFVSWLLRPLLGAMARWIQPPHAAKNGEDVNAGSCPASAQPFVQSLNLLGTCSHDFTVRRDQINNREVQRALSRDLRPYHRLPPPPPCLPLAPLRHSLVAHANDQRPLCPPHSTHRYGVQCQRSRSRSSCSHT